MPGKTSKKATPRKQAGKNDQILALLIGLDKKFTEKFEGLSQKVERMDQEAKAEREKNAEEHEITRSYFRKFETVVLRRLDEMDLNILGFKSEILSVVDVTRKEYDETRQERLVVGAVQDQQRSAIEALKASDEKQNELIASLDTRVASLEMNQAA